MQPPRIRRSLLIFFFFSSMHRFSRFDCKYPNTHTRRAYSKTNMMCTKMLVPAAQVVQSFTCTVFFRVFRCFFFFSIQIHRKLIYHVYHIIPHTLLHYNTYLSVPNRRSNHKRVSRLILGKIVKRARRIGILCRPP